ncbi:hypothetical protein QO199_24530 [Serratia bockelmannii]|uniref:Apea-like HEPN domain-containing protein n=1 Tax=Serratia bockelmannii TaxID=2703793 RepID=A0ABT8LWX4_9GAMM|nr:hypothetical protein [Serratia bockelmannii]MDN6881811.1 hypothetical protein [Serratia bockelmannii]HBH6890677.1 hypothetical protein [Serratia marcescens]
MKTTTPEKFIDAFNKIWELPAGMSFDEIIKSRELINLREVADEHCYSKISGSLFDPYLCNGLRKLGVPCFFPAGSSLVETDMMVAARQCYEELNRSTENLISFCPLDCADILPQIKFGKASIKHFSKSELDALLNSVTLQRQPGYKPADTARLSQFLWLMVEHTESLPAEFSERYWGWGKQKDTPGTVHAYKTPFPDDVEQAIFLLMLAPWQNWLINEDNHWRPFDIPWVHTLSGDIFTRQKPIPSADTLTWVEKYYYDDKHDDWIEYEAPYDYDYKVTDDQLLPFIDATARQNLLRAVNAGFINKAARHQFVNAFIKGGIDEFLSHIVMIDACIGTKKSNGLKTRLVGLMNDASVKQTIDSLYEARSNYVHGDKLDKIDGKNIKIARDLACKTLNAIINAVGQSPTLKRKTFLENINNKGWKLLKTDEQRPQKMTLKDVFDLIQVCIKNKPHVTDREMRSMFTHVFSSTLKPYTVFTGFVSESAVKAIEEMKGKYQGHKVVREHPEKFQTKITQLIKEMRETRNWNFEKFEEKVKALAYVNITTAKENSALSKKDASYESLGIQLVHWKSLNVDVRRIIRQSLLRADIANRGDWPID